MTQKTFFTSDTHLGHANILKLGRGRPFASIEEHDETIVKRWNAVVGPDDDVWHLGDFAYRSTPEAGQRVFDRLNGRKNLIRGNHDEEATLALPWASVQPYAEIEIIADRKRKLVLFHYPMQEWAGFWGKGRGQTIHLHGHTHDSVAGWRWRSDVAVDTWDFTPVTLDQILARIANNPDINPQTLLPFEEPRG